VPHRYVFVAEDQNCADQGEINGTWWSEVDPMSHHEIDVVHQ
jgi:hypothetical protein